jgi:hypothetical protein
VEFFREKRRKLARFCVFLGTESGVGEGAVMQTAAGDWSRSWRNKLRGCVFNTLERPGKQVRGEFQIRVIPRTIACSNAVRHFCRLPACKPNRSRKSFEPRRRPESVSALRGVPVMIGRNAIAFFVAMGTIAVLAGCGGLGSLPPLNETPQPTSVIFVAAPPSSLAVNASATIYAATAYPIGIQSGSENTLVTYSLSCGSTNACGTLSASDELGAVVYTAPAAIPSGATVTVRQRPTPEWTT